MKQYANSHPLLEKMDRTAQWTGLDQLGGHNVRRRPMRWLPLAALALATAGLLGILLRPDAYWLGYAGLMLGFAVGCFMPMFGPLRLGPNDNTDERDQMLSRNAYYVAFTSAVAASLAGILAITGSAYLHEWPREVILRALMALTHYLLAVIATVPTLYASWIVARPLSDDED